jgi:orotidine-5'-phosphate decarboxylase
MTSTLISRPRSIIPACDVSNKQEFEDLIKQTHDISGIGAYKIGLELTIQYGLKSLVDIIRRYTNAPVIYDHQKGGTDIPELGPKFSKVCRSAGVDAIILFPFGGLATERQWIKACQDEGLVVLVGAHMTQKNFLRSEGGFIADDSPQKMYEVAVESGVTDFVVPGNKPELVVKYKGLFESLGISPTLYAPGFVAQGGAITECGNVAGERWHAIVGSAIYAAKDIKEATKILTQQIDIR